MYKMTDFLITFKAVDHCGIIYNGCKNCNWITLFLWMNLKGDYPSTTHEIVG